jgi:hypothetical protein
VRAFLCCDLGLTPEVRGDHASYIVSWLEVLKNEKRAIFQAASNAQRAVAYLRIAEPDIFPTSFLVALTNPAPDRRQSGRLEALRQAKHLQLAFRC